MRRLLPLLGIILAVSCRTDYDIEEVASDQYLGRDHTHSDSCQVCGEEEIGEHDHHHEEEVEHDLAGSERHVHGAGERNHGTEWFFNQPWAATFIWGKMIRDSVILIVLAAAVALASGYRRKHR